MGSAPLHGRPGVRDARHRHPRPRRGRARRPSSSGLRRPRAARARDDPCGSSVGRGGADDRHRVAGGGGGVIRLLATALAAFSVHPLVGTRVDAQLVNPWGLAASPTGPWWVSNEAQDSSTLYSSTGRKQALTVHVDGGPTGVVWNGGTGFVVRGGGRAATARFIYACEDGTVRAWAPTVPTGWSRQAVV